MKNIYKIEICKINMKKGILIIFLLLNILSVTFAADVIDEGKSTEALEKGNKIVNYVRSLFGIGFFLSMLYSSMLWTFSGGNVEKIEKAKRNLALATIGFVISFLLPSFIEFGFTSARESAIGLISP